MHISGVDSVRIKREASESPHKSLRAAQLADTDNGAGSRRKAHKLSAGRHSSRRSLNDDNGGDPANASLTESALRSSGYRHIEAIDELLAKRPDLKLVDPSAGHRSASAAAIDLGPDEEVWLFQCARNVDVERLVGRKLTLEAGESRTVRLGDGSSAADAIEYHVDGAPSAGVRTRSMTIACRTSTGGQRRCELLCVKPAGTVRLHTEIQDVVVADFGRTKQRLVPYPSGLKVRHPLHGADFEARTQLAGSVERAIRAAVLESDRAKAEKIVPVASADITVKSEKRTRRIKAEPMDVEQDNANGTPTEEAAKKSSGRKRKAVATETIEATSSDRENEAPKKSKRVKKEKTIKQEADEEPGSNLDWLSAI